MLGSHKPRPYVEVLERVAGFKKLVNPEEKESFAGGRVRQLTGLCKPRPSTIKKYEHFMGTTSNLHFRIAKDPTKDVVCIQNKQTIDVKDWSPVEYVWCAKGDRYSKGTEDFKSWLAELKNAPSVPITVKRRDELDTYLNSCSWRLDERQLFAFKENIRHLHTLRPETCLHWENDGLFSNEHELHEDDPDDLDSDGEPSVDASIALRDSNCIVRSRLLRQQLQNQPLSNMVARDDFIAYKPFYNDDVPERKRKPIYVGRIASVDKANAQVQIDCYNTGSTKPLKMAKGVKTKYTLSKGYASVQDVKVCNIYYGFKPSKFDANGRFNLCNVEKNAILKAIAGEAAGEAVSAIAIE